MIIATAGHVDHGKTSLIKQLTGVETDRLDEEKRRGLSIDLGFAYRKPTSENDKVLGFIDVPGHQRFINTMISGLSGIDMGMLVVAADDGIMPQTLEHLDIMHLLGIQAFIGVITKTDRADKVRTETVASEVAALLGKYQANEVTLFPVSNTTGEGIDELQSWLDQQLSVHKKKPPQGYFRLSIDRSFNLKGIGLVVTGTVMAGEVSEGDSVRLLPQDIILRVRGMHVQDEPATHADTGVRCALNLSGDIEKANIDKGDWLIGQGAESGSCTFTAKVQFLDTPVKRRHGMPLKLYLGARHIPAKLGFLSDDAAQQLVQIITEEPVCCCRGERFILRDYSEKFLLGGGNVLDPAAQRLRKLSPDYANLLATLELNDFAQSLDTLLIQIGAVIDFEAYRSAWNLSDAEADALLQKAGLKNSLEFPHTSESRFALSSDRWQDMHNMVFQAVKTWQGENTDKPGIPVDDLAKLVEEDFDARLIKAVLDVLTEKGVAGNKLEVAGGLVKQAGFRAGMSDKVKEQWQQVEQILQKQGLEIPLLSELENKTSIRGREMNHLVNAALKAGLLHRVSQKRVGLPDTLLALAEKVQEIAENKPEFSVIEFKNYIGTGRNYVIELLDFMDRVGFTQRVGNERKIVDASVPDRVFR
ncbi:MAG: selenocysteine-specific translation elongation factor [Gammaproteobacteria bacterium]|nr:selenocysteine-specific translation elongation factor [Gammaproteobacteria bacterium]